MIQRIQTVYLLLVAIIATIFLIKSPIYHKSSGIYHNQSDSTSQVAFADVSFTQTTLKTDITTETKSVSQINMYLVFSLIVIIILSVFALVVYKNRALQLRLASFTIIFILLMWFFMYYHVNAANNVFEQVEDQNYKFITWTTIFIMIFNILAIRGIVKDIKLMKSVDRLR